MRQHNIWCVCVRSVWRGMPDRVRHTSPHRTGTFSECTGTVFWYLDWWWFSEPKHVAEFIILITNICCYWLNKLLYYCKTQRDGSYKKLVVNDDLRPLVCYNWLILFASGLFYCSRSAFLGLVFFRVRNVNFYILPPNFLYNVWK